MLSSPRLDAAQHQVEKTAETVQPAMQRVLGAPQLTLLGLGAIIGTGIFVLSGQVAAEHTGPAITLAFALAGLSAMLAALCYSELLSMVRLGGSAYTYARLAFGELPAWCIGWALLLEYSLAAASVSVGWSAYVTAWLEHACGWQVDARYTAAPWVWQVAKQGLRPSGAYGNVPALLSILFLTALLALGVQRASRFNAAMVLVKLLVIGAFVVVAGRAVQWQLWQPYLPANTHSFGHFGWSGLLQGSSMLFFAYNGFDAISTAAVEARQPQRDIPLSILASVLLSAVLYILVAGSLTGVVAYDKLAVAHPISVGLAATGALWLQPWVEFGAVAGLSSVMLVNMYSQPRVMCAMAQDGLLPASLGRIHPQRRLPLQATLLNGLLCGLCGACLPMQVLGDLMCVGTLFAFTGVSLGTMLLRWQKPHWQRPFRIPGPAWGVPLASTCVCATLFAVSKPQTLGWFSLWLLAGLLYYAVRRRCYPRLQRIVGGDGHRRRG